MTARELYDLEAPVNRARFASEGARVLIGDPDLRVRLPIDSRRDIYVRPAVKVVDRDPFGEAYARLIDGLPKLLGRAESWFWSDAGASILTTAFVTTALCLLCAIFIHSLVVHR